VLLLVLVGVVAAAVPGAAAMFFLPSMVLMFLGCLVVVGPGALVAVVGLKVVGQVVVAGLAVVVGQLEQKLVTDFPRLGYPPHH
jgi:hypothetical protein